MSTQEEMSYLEDFATRLTVLREQKGVSAREMSLDMGQGHSFIHGIENKRHFPKMLHFFYICEYLEISPRDFFDYTSEAPRLDNELFTEIQKLDRASKEYYLNMIRETNNRPR